MSPVVPRFFVPDLDPSIGLSTLPADEAAHLGRVLRLESGAIVRVFDGAGHEWRAEVVEARRERATVRLLEPIAAAPEPGVAITLVIAVLKGDKMDDVVRDAVMIGAHAVQPVASSRTQISTSTVARRGSVGRWQRVAVSSAKQCGRAVVPRVGDVVPFERWLENRRSEPGLLLVEPTAHVRTTRLRDLPAPGQVSLVIGPEGGWAPDEIEAAIAAGLVPVRLGGRTLRADAVPLAALAVCQELWDRE